MIVNDQGMKERVSVIDTFSICTDQSGRNMSLKRRAGKSISCPIEQTRAEEIYG